MKFKSNVNIEDGIGINGVAGNEGEAIRSSGSNEEWFPAKEDKPVLFISETALSPATPGEPTLSEVNAYALVNSIRSEQAFYTGTNVPTDDQIRVYFIDSTGSAVESATPVSVDAAVAAAAGGGGGGSGPPEMCYANIDVTYNWNTPGLGNIPFYAPAIAEGGWSHTAGTHEFTYTGDPARIEIRFQAYLVCGGSGVPYQPAMLVRNSYSSSATRAYAVSNIINQAGMNSTMLNLYYVDTDGQSNTTYSFFSLMDDLSVRTPVISPFTGNPVLSFVTLSAIN